jgi:low temperature requirement protein LtrA
VGVIVLALGLPDMFQSIDDGGAIDNRVMVAGYVVMRVAMVFQWGRAARQDPDRRVACMTYIKAILIAQAGWVALLIANASLAVTIVCVVLLTLVEFAGPWIAETRKGGTPWHAHHIAERYGLLVIIALGEGVIGTIASLSAVVGPEGPGWSVDAAALAVAGIGLTFGMWWIYFVIPSAEALHARRERSFGWGYGHIPLIGAVVATGGGLHVAAYYLEEESVLGASATVLTVVIPVAVFALSVFVLYTYLTRSFDPFHLTMMAVTAVLLAAPLLLASAGASMAWCLVVLSLSPWVTVVGYELHSHRHNAQVIAQLSRA